jgi:outer membrane protein OmpA-like peptidoglycan-associated protein
MNRFPFIRLILLIGTIAGATARAQEMQIEAELLGPVGTDTSRVGDRVFARVLTPAALKGDSLEGKVTEARSGARNGGVSVLSFGFETLQHAGGTIPIKTETRRMTNSQGRIDTDDAGRVIKKGNPSSAGATKSVNAVGGLAGRITHSQEVALGQQAASTAAVVTQGWSANVPDIRFGTGSQVLLSARSLSGPALVNLRPPSVQPAPTAMPSTPAPPAAVAAAAQTQAAAATAPSAPSAAAGASAQPEMTALKTTFIPGEKTLFFDDFTDMTPDDAPPHFKVRGAAPQLMQAGGIRQLSFNGRGSAFPNLTNLPKNFTFEAEIKVDGQGRSDSTLILSSKGKQILQWWLSANLNYMDLIVSLRAPYQELGRKRVSMTWQQPVKIALWVQNGRMRSFANSEKLLDFNQVDMPPIDSIELSHGFLGANPSLAYRSVRFAESTPDFSQVISASGRYVTHGVLFDTDSDCLKPESAPVIQSIAAGLSTNPNLRLLIEGHTDSVGNAAHNMDLSKRRADAVKAVLVAQFKVDPERLSTAGLGSTKPIDSNDTPQGRSQNRRVELVKQ